MKGKWKHLGIPGGSGWKLILLTMSELIWMDSLTMDGSVDDVWFCSLWMVWLTMGMKLQTLGGSA